MRVTHELEEALHHHFKNPALLVTALTHTSYANEAKHGVRHNERLEFLGDSVLSIVVEVHLNSNCIGKGEGHSKKLAEQQAAKEALALMGY